MQFKLVPEPPESLAYVETVHQAVPPVPGTEDDCCARIMRRTEISPRDEARTWLTFLRALELAAETDRGFYRIRRDPDPDALEMAFLERVYGARKVLEILDQAERPLAAETVFERFRETVPAYEQFKHRHRLEETWGERVRRLLEWCVLFGLAERGDEGYVVSSSSSPM